MTVKSHRPTLRDAVAGLADDLHHALVSHPIPDRVPGQLNVAEAVLALVPYLARIAGALERLSPPPTPDPPVPGSAEYQAAKALSMSDPPWANPPAALTRSGVVQQASPVQENST